MKESKRSWFTNYFKNNLNDLKSTWEGIKKLMPLKELSNIALSSIFDNERLLTEPRETANVFNKYFVNVATFNLRLDTLKVIFLIFSLQSI